jgi:hypothetical protein
MNTTAIRTGMLSNFVAWLRAGYPAQAPQFGHAALVALCPATGPAHSAVSVTSFGA